MKISSNNIIRGHATGHLAETPQNNFMASITRGKSTHSKESIPMSSKHNLVESSITNSLVKHRSNRVSASKHEQSPLIKAEDLINKKAIVKSNKKQKNADEFLDQTYRLLKPLQAINNPKEKSNLISTKVALSSDIANSSLNNSTVIIPKDLGKSNNQYIQARQNGQTRSVIGNSKTQLTNTFAGEEFSPQINPRKIEELRNVSGKERRKTHFVDSIMGGTIKASALRDPDYNQSIKRTRIHQNKITAGNVSGTFDDRYPQSTNSKVQTITGGNQKGEPSLPGPLGWPKLTGTPNLTMGQKEHVLTQQSMIKESAPVAVFQNITKFGKRQISPITPEQTSSIAPFGKEINDKQFKDQNWQNKTYLTPGGAYSSTAPQRTKSLTESAEPASPSVKKVRPDSILSRNIYKNHNTSEPQGNQNQTVKLSLKQMIPKYGNKTGQSNNQNSGISNRYESVYGQNQGNVPGNKNSLSNTHSPSNSQSRVEGKIQKFTSPEPTSGPEQKLKGPDMRAIADKQQMAKEYPLSTKNKSIPPFSLPNAGSHANIQNQNRNLPPVLMNPIQQTKSQYYKNIVPGIQKQQPNNSRQVVSSINTLGQLHDHQPSRVMVATGQKASNLIERDILNSTNKSNRQNLLNTIDLESNKAQTLFRTQWNSEQRWEQKGDFKNEQMRIQQNETSHYTGMSAIGPQDKMNKRSGKNILSPQLNKKSKYGGNLTSGVQTEGMNQIQDAYQSNVSSQSLPRQSNDKFQSKYQPNIVDPETDLSQLDQFDRILRRKNAKNNESNSRERHPRYRFDDQNKSVNLSHISYGSKDNDLFAIKNSIGETIPRKQRHGYQPATVGRSTDPQTNKKTFLSPASQYQNMSVNSGNGPNLLNIEPLHSCLVYLKPNKPYEQRSTTDLQRFHEEPFNLFQLSFIHFSEQFFFANRPQKYEKNFQNVQRAALMILVIGKSMRGMQLLKQHNQKLIDAQNALQQKSSYSGEQNIDQKYVTSVTTALGFVQTIEHDLYQIIKELVGGICQWVLKRINRPKHVDVNSSVDSTQIQENSWVKKIQQILKTQYEDQFQLVQVIDYAQIVSNCQRIQEKIILVKNKLNAITNHNGQDKGTFFSENPYGKLQNRQIIESNFDKLQQYLQQMIQMIQQIIIQQDSSKIIPIEKFLQIMNKMEQMDQQIGSQLNNNMASAQIPRNMMESAMTTLGNMKNNRNLKSVDRKKNSTPHSFTGSNASSDNRNENQFLITGQKTSTIDEAKQMRDTRSNLMKGLAQKQSSGANIKGQHQVGSNGNILGQFMIDLNIVHKQDENQDTYRFETELTDRQESVLVDINSHQKSLRERIEAYKLEEEQQMKQTQSPRLVPNSSRRSESSTTNTPVQQILASNAPPNQDNDQLKHFALVLDLDETLVHFKDSKYLTDDQKLKIRPGVAQFFEALNPYFTFIVFTAAQKMYADFVISRIDPQGIYIKDRFYRNQCKQIGRHQAKDLNLVLNALNRKIQKQTFKQDQQQISNQEKQAQVAAAVTPQQDFSNTQTVQLFDLNRVIIIDNLSESFQLQPLNGIKIRDWFGNDLQDRHLLDLIPALKHIAQNKVHDVRLELSKIRKNQLHQTIGNGPFMGGAYANGSSFKGNTGSSFSAFGNQRFSHQQQHVANGIQKFIDRRLNR